VKTVSDGKIKVLAKLFEKPGRQSAPSWSPDGKRLVFVSYQLVP
jgi:Tol biopolymer transport system component